MIPLALRVATSALVVVALASSCGSSTDDGPGGGASSGGADGGADASTSPSSSGGSSDGSTSDGSTSGGPPPPTCPSPSTSVRCTLPSDATGARIDDAWVTTDAACKTSVYVSVDLDETSSLPDFKLRRYTLAKLEPCELVRDTTLPEVLTGERIAADDAGNVYAATVYGTAEKGVSRIAPGARVLCTNNGVNLTSREVASIVMAPDGKRGYVAFIDINHDDDPKLARITTTATGCAIDPLPVTGATLSGARGLGIDTKQRLHVADHANSNGNKRFVILEDKGAEAAFVAAYDGAPPGQTLSSIFGLTRCKRGICHDAFSSVVAVSEDGVYLGVGSYPVEVSTMNSIVRSSPSGPIFYLATETPQTRTYIGVLKDP